MLSNLPIYVSLVFGLTALTTLFLFYRTLQKAHSEAVRQRSTVMLLILLVWLTGQATLSLTGVYQPITTAQPPKLVLIGILPAFLAIVLLLSTRSGKQIVDSLPLERLTWLHTIRVPVELVLYWLFLNKAVPELMTFEGRNSDILSGLTAPVVAYWGFRNRQPNRPLLLGWNLLCLGLLINIVVNALLSAPSPMQQFAFEQPNIAITYFPFGWLPTFVVPIVMVSHLAAIRQLVRHSA